MENSLLDRRQPTSADAADVTADSIRFRVLDAGTPEGLAAWIQLWQKWPTRDVMAHPEYVRLFAGPRERVVAVVGEEPGGAVLFPLILRALEAQPWARSGEHRKDATSPYGYGGPFAWGVRSPGDVAYWRAYFAWCAREGIVSTFARLSLFPEQLACIPGRVEERGRNVVISLAGGAEALWHGYTSRVRRWVRIAERAGLEVEVDRSGARLDDFLAVYAHTMQRRRADGWYYFSRRFFETLIERLRDDCVFFHARNRGKVVSSYLILCSQEHIYYFLGGTLEESFPLGPNYLLMHRAAEWAIAEKKRACVLGGGFEPNDGVYRYKCGFAPHGEVPFKVMCLTHDEQGCRELLSDRAAFDARQGSRTSTPRVGFFPAYRA